MTDFVCNLCGATNRAVLKEMGREVASCTTCGSTVRLRALIQLLSVELFGIGAPMTEFPKRKGLRGLGMSDSHRFAEALADRFSYTNTYYHQEPRFDVLAMDERHLGQYDFIVSSEVMEHIPPPPERGFETLFRLLKPNGVLLLTVPYTLERSTQEHFPELHDFTVAELRGGLVLVNRKRDGGLETFDDLVFHGGGGSTLEMRRYSEQSLRDLLKEVGFSSVRIAAEPATEFGVTVPEDWSLPIAARKGPFSCDASGVAEIMGEYRAICARNSKLHAEYLAIEAELKAVREWTKNREIELTAELVERTRWVERLEGQLAERTTWAQALEKDLDHHVKLAQAFQSEFQERSGWAEELQQDLEKTREELKHLRNRLWVRMGRKIGRA